MGYNVLVITDSISACKSSSMETSLRWSSSAIDLLELNGISIGYLSFVVELDFGDVETDLRSFDLEDLLL